MSLEHVRVGDTLIVSGNHARSETVTKVGRLWVYAGGWAFGKVGKTKEGNSYASTVYAWRRSKQAVVARQVLSKSGIDLAGRVDAVAVYDLLRGTLGLPFLPPLDSFEVPK